MTHPYLDWPGPLALAHRGGGAEAPENSRSAIEHMLALGFRYLETDVRLTLDGVVVLHHDATLDRTTDASGPLGRLTWPELAEVRLRDGEPPPRLDQVLAEHPELRLNIDLKEDAVVTPALGVIERAGADDRVAIASFSGARLRRARRIAPEGPAVSFGMDEVSRLLAVVALPGPLRHRVLRRGVPTPAAAAGLRAHCVQIPVSYRGIPVATARFVDLAHELGLQVHVWTVDEAPLMHELLDRGVDGIVTDRPSVLREVLRERGQWVDPG